MVAISDEVYERLTYPGHDHLSLATLGGMSDRTVTISSMSKTYSITGWRVGYAVAEDGLMEAVRRVHDYVTVCAPSASQRAAVSALKLPESYYSSIARSYDKKRRILMKGLAEIGFKCVEPEGAYFILADFTELSDKDDFEFAKQLVREARVSTVPGSSFYSQRGGARDRVRFSFCKMDGTLEEAVSRMKAALL